MYLEKGFEIINSVYTENQINRILKAIKELRIENRFGVREFLYKYSELQKLVFNSGLKNIIRSISPICKLSIKSIYFDKPPNANWNVNWHQDLTINLKSKNKIEGFKNWRKKDSRVVVQPPIDILENIFTIRIHLDDCSIRNGALRVIKNSHNIGVINMKEWSQGQEENEVICEINKGGILVMKPLILHSSRRVENCKNRRVIHLEFCDHEMSNKLDWKEPILF